MTPEHVAREHREREEPERPHVRGRRDLSAPRLLRREPHRRAVRARRVALVLFGDLRDAEVEHLHDLRRVLRFETPRNTFSGLRSRCTTPASCAAPSAWAICSSTSAASAGWNGPRFETRRQVLAFEELHHEKRNLRLRIDARRDDLDDVLARDARPDARLLLELRARGRVEDERAVHQLERAHLPRRQLLHDVHRAHAALVERFDDAIVVCEEGSRLEAHLECAAKKFQTVSWKSG